MDHPCWICYGMTLTEREKDLNGAQAAQYNGGKGKNLPRLKMGSPRGIFDLRDQPTHPHVNENIPGKTTNCLL